MACSILLNVLDEKKKADQYVPDWISYGHKYTKTSFHNTRVINKGISMKIPIHTPSTIRGRPPILFQWFHDWRWQHIAIQIYTMNDMPI